MMIALSHIKMNKSDRPLRCYVAAVHNSQIDPDLERRGFCRSMIVFAIPSLGVQYRCRARGELIDLEFGALFSLLKFIRSRLKDEGIKAVRVASSNPEFIFAFTGNSRHLTEGSTRRRMLSKYQRQLDLLIEYVEPARNRALASPADYPSIPKAAKPVIEPDQFDNGTRFQRFQRGLRL